MGWEGGKSNRAVVRRLAVGVLATCFSSVLRRRADHEVMERQEDKGMGMWWMDWTHRCPADDERHWIDMRQY